MSIPRTLLTGYGTFYINELAEIPVVRYNNDSDDGNKTSLCSASCVR